MGGECQEGILGTPQQSPRPLQNLHHTWAPAGTHSAGGRVLGPGGHGVPRGQKSECPRTTAELALEEACQQVGKNQACTGTALLSQPGQGRGKGRPVSKGQSLSPGNGSDPP